MNKDRFVFFVCLSVVIILHALFLSGLGLLKLDTHFSKNNTNEISIKTKLNLYAEKLQVKSRLSQDKIQSKQQESKKQSSQRIETSDQANDLDSGLDHFFTRYLSHVRGMISQNKFYPATAERLGHEGTVVIELTILSDGKIMNYRLLNKAPYDSLNRATIEMISKVNKFNPIPKQIKKSEIVITIPIAYEIN